MLPLSERPFNNLLASSYQTLAESAPEPSMGKNKLAAAEEQIGQVEGEKDLTQLSEDQLQALAAKVYAIECPEQELEKLRGTVRSMDKELNKDRQHTGGQREQLLQKRKQLLERREQLLEKIDGLKAAQMCKQRKQKGGAWLKSQRASEASPRIPTAQMLSGQSFPKRVVTNPATDIGRQPVRGNGLSLGPARGGMPPHAGHRSQGHRFVAGQDALQAAPLKTSARASMSAGEQEQRQQQQGARSAVSQPGTKCGVQGGFSDGLRGFLNNMKSIRRPAPMARCANCNVEFQERMLESLPDPYKDKLCQDCWRQDYRSFGSDWPRPQQQQQPPTQQLPLLRSVAAGPNPRAGSLVARPGGSSSSAATAAGGGAAAARPLRPPAAEQAKRPTRRAAQEEIQDHPIEIGSSDDEDAAPAPAAATRRCERSNLAESMGTRYKGFKALYPAAGGRTAVEVVADDLNRLAEMEFLNDTVIDYYMRVLEEELIPADKGRFHFFNSFFFKKLTEKTPGMGKLKAEEREKKNHERVKKWTKGVDIFQKDYLFIPIHDALHWSLIIVCHPGELARTSSSSSGSGGGSKLQPEAGPSSGAGGGEAGSSSGGRKTPCLLHLDSMSDGHKDVKPGPVIRAYLQHEWARKQAERHALGHADNLPQQWSQEHQGEVMKITKEKMPDKRLRDLPQQDNHCDCGLFVLTYIQFFIAAAPPFIDISMINARPRRDGPQVELSGMANFLRKNWFQPMNASMLREYLRISIFKLMVDQASDKLKEIPQYTELREAVTDYEALPMRANSRFLPPAEWISVAAEQAEAAAAAAAAAGVRLADLPVVDDLEEEEEGNQGTADARRRAGEAALKRAAAAGVDGGTSLDGGRRAGRAPKRQQRQQQDDDDDDDPIEDSEESSELHLNKRTRPRPRPSKRVEDFSTDKEQQDADMALETEQVSSQRGKRGRGAAAVTARGQQEEVVGIDQEGQDGSPQVVGGDSDVSLNTSDSDVQEEGHGQAQNKRQRRQQQEADLPCANSDKEQQLWETLQSISNGDPEALLGCQYNRGLYDQLLQAFCVHNPETRERLEQAEREPEARFQTLLDQVKHLVPKFKPGARGLAAPNPWESLGLGTSSSRPSPKLQSRKCKGSSGGRASKAGAAAAAAGGGKAADPSQPTLKQCLSGARSPSGVLIGPSLPWQQAKQPGPAAAAAASREPDSLCLEQCITSAHGGRKDPEAVKRLQEALENEGEYAKNDWQPQGTLGAAAAQAMLVQQAGVVPVGGRHQQLGLSTEEGDLDLQLAEPPTVVSSDEEAEAGGSGGGDGDRGGRSGGSSAHQAGAGGSQQQLQPKQQESLLKWGAGMFGAAFGVGAAAVASSLRKRACPGDAAAAQQAKEERSAARGRGQQGGRSSCGVPPLLGAHGFQSAYSADFGKWEQGPGEDKRVVFEKVWEGWEEVLGPAGEPGDGMDPGDEADGGFQDPEPEEGDGGKGARMESSPEGGSSQVVDLMDSDDDNGDRAGTAGQAEETRPAASGVESDEEVPPSRASNRDRVQGAAAAAGAGQEQGGAGMTTAPAGHKPKLHHSMQAAGGVGDRSGFYVAEDGGSKGGAGAARGAQGQRAPSASEELKQNGAPSGSGPSDVRGRGANDAGAKGEVGEGLQAASIPSGSPNHLASTMDGGKGQGVAGAGSGAVALSRATRRSRKAAKPKYEGPGGVTTGSGPPLSANAAAAPRADSEVINLDADDAN